MKNETSLYLHWNGFLTYLFERIFMENEILWKLIEINQNIACFLASVRLTNRKSNMIKRLITENHPINFRCCLMLSNSETPRFFMLWLFFYQVYAFYNICYSWIVEWQIKWLLVTGSRIDLKCSKVNAGTFLESSQHPLITILYACEKYIIQNYSWPQALQLSYNWGKTCGEREIK